MKVVPDGLELVMSVDPEILGGEPTFKGTRIPLETVVDNLAGGYSIDFLLYNFPSLTREHIMAVLQWERGLAIKAAGMASVR